MSDIKKLCEACKTCAHYKKYAQQYGILPTKTHDPNPWTKVCIDMLGPWTIPQDNKKKKKKKATTKPFVNLQELLVLTIIDPDTNFIEMVALLPSKWSHCHRKTPTLLPEPLIKSGSVIIPALWNVFTMPVRNSPDSNSKSYCNCMVLNPAQ
jgi:hypothetical protein